MLYISWQIYGHLATYLPLQTFFSVQIEKLMIYGIQRRWWALRFLVFSLCVASAFSAWYLNTVQLRPLATNLEKITPKPAKKSASRPSNNKKAALKPHFSGDSTPTPPPYAPTVDPLPDVQLLRFVLQKGKEGIPVL